MLLRTGKTLDTRPQTPKKDPNTQRPAMAGNTDGGEPAPPNTQEKTTSRFAIRKVMFPRAADNTAANKKETPSSDPPPIVVPFRQANKTAENLIDSDVKTILKAKLVPADFVIKNLNNATQIRANNAKTYAEIQKILSEAKMEFYTYTNQAPKLKKFVVYGLCKEDIADIKQNLQDYGLNPVDIKPMHQKQPRNSQTNYLCYFDEEDNVTLQILSEVKYICSTVVSWAHYRQPATNCLQCRNCFRYKHSAESCHMTAICMYCAEPHPSTACPLLELKLADKRASIPEYRLKCTNCKGNHTAVFKLCPARTQLINTRHAERRNTAKAKTFADAPLPTHNAWNTNKKPLFPPLITKMRTITTTPAELVPTTSITRSRSHSPPDVTRKPQRTNNKQTPSSSRRPADHSRSHQQKPAIQGRIINEKVSFQNQLEKHNRSHAALKNPINLNNSNANHNDNNRFSPQDLMAIFQEILENISRCNTKQEQLNALMALAVKYMPQ